MACEPILVVDDAPVSLKLTRVVLSGAGYDVRTATDAEQALNLLDSFRPRLILTGIRLPGMDGLNLARQIKSTAATRDTIVVALTGCTAKADEQRALAAGCAGYIVKPFDTRSLVQKVRAYLGDTEPRRGTSVLARIPNGEAEGGEAGLHSKAPISAQAQQQPVAEIQQASRDPLFGKRCALVGISAEVGSEIAQLLERERAFSLVLSLSEVEARPGLLDSCDLIVLELHSESQWLKENLARLARPVLVLTSPALVDEFEASLRTRPHELLISPWRTDEVLLRARMAISRSVPAAAPGGRPKIVLADEDRTTSALLNTVLQNYGMECREARDGGEAMELIRTFAPDAAILDVSMPNLDGLQVLSLLKSDPATAATRVIFLTARQQETDIVKAFALGAEDYITKPFNPMELVARLKRILRREP